MRGSRDVTDTGAIEEAASEWLIKRDSGAWSDEDQRSFDDWLTASSLHKVAYLRLESAWENAARLKALGAGISGDRPPPRGHWNLGPRFAPPTRPARERSLRLQGLAAAVVVLAIAGIGSYLTLSERGTHFSTSIGGIDSISLRDGSTVTLNTDSEIRVVLTETERHIELRRGEAFFDVAKDLKRPFVVTARGRRIVALGTQFSVRREANDVEVAVTQGQVRVEGAGDARGRANEAVLMPGSLAHVGTAGILVQRDSVPQVEELLSWRSGMLRFRDEPLGLAVAEFNRYNDRKIVIADPAVAALKIEGNFRATNVEGFVRLLQSGFPVSASSDGREIVLTSSAAVQPH